MATFNPFNGSAQPVFNTDVHNGTQTGAITAAALVQVDGPNLDFFGLVVENTSNAAQDLRSELGLYADNSFDPGIVVQILQEIQTKGVVAKYQVEGTSAGAMSIAVYPQEVWTAATLQAAIRALGASGTVTVTESDGTTRTVDISGSDVTDTGFKLATS